MKKFKLEYLHIADGASIDQRGKLSIYGIFEKVNLRKIPGKLLKFVITGSVFFKKSVGENINFKIKILDSEKKELRIKPISIKVPINEKASKKGGKIGFTVEIGNLEFKMPGKHQIVVYANKEKVGIKEMIIERSL